MNEDSITGGLPSVASVSAGPQPLDRRKLFAIGGLTLTIVTSIVSIAFDSNRVSVINSLLSDQRTSNPTTFLRYLTDLAAAHTSDQQTRVIAIVEFAAVLIAAVCFIAWFHRAYANLPHIGATTTRYGTGWAIGGWFVPVLNLWRPKQISNDIWRGSDPEHPGEQPSWSEKVSPLISWWWGIWILWGIVNRVTAEGWTQAKTLHAMRSAADGDIASECLSILAAGLAIAVVIQITKRQRARSSEAGLTPVSQVVPE